MKQLFIFIFLATLVCCTSCKKTPEAPKGTSKIELGTTTVEYSDVVAVFQTSLNDPTSQTINNYGHYWSTSPFLSDNDPHSSLGNNIPNEIFSTLVDTLKPSTTYYVRPYFKVNNTVKSGTQQQFTTQGSFICGNNVYYAGKFYHTVQIDSQCWFKENLNIGTRINGSQNQTNNNMIEKCCVDDDEKNCDTYGGLYQWDEMMQYVATEGARGICPDGWHIPSDAEWSILTNSLGGNNVAGGKMKSISGWINSGNGTNSSGFTALPGACWWIGYFMGIGIEADFWSSMQTDATTASYQQLFYDRENIREYTFEKTNKCSIRCLQD